MNLRPFSQQINWRKTLFQIIEFKYLNPYIQNEHVPHVGWYLSMQKQ